MFRSKLDKFLKDVLSYIKYPFIKEEVKDELQNHVLEKIDYYMEKGHSREEAEELAINDMGDPKEIGIGLYKQHKPPFFKAILITIGILFSALIIFFIVVGILTRPLPEHKRNLTEADAKIVLEFNDETEERTAIIRTYKEEEYNSFDDEEIRKIMDIINGNIEGDIPAVRIYEDKAIIYINFYKDEEPIMPDYLPEIEIEVPQDEASTAAYSVENNKIIFDELTEEDGEYSYKFERYRTQYELYFMHYNIVKIRYEIDGEKYISIFGLNSTNADLGTDFFENEYLESPIEPEI